MKLLECKKATKFQQSNFQKNLNRFQDVKKITLWYIMGYTLAYLPYFSKRNKRNLRKNEKKGDMNIPLP